MAEPVPLLAPVKPVQAEPRVWQRGGFVEDRWQALADDAPLGDHPALVTLSRWRRERALLLAHEQGVGVRLAAAEGLEPAAEEINRLRLVALPFPKFSDGRSYSVARRLREAGFTAEVRATGDVLLDQIPLMLRAGFDAFEITHAATLRALETGSVPALTRVYQTAADGVLTAALDQRRRAASR